MNQLLQRTFLLGIYIISSLTVKAQFGDEIILHDHNVPLGLKTLSGIVATDYDIDGFTDILGINETEVYTYKQNGDGNYFQVEILSNPASINKMSAFDFTGNGYPDLIIFSTDGAVRIYPNTNGSFSSDFLTVNGVIDFSKGDYTGDGIEELVIGMPSEFRVYRYNESAELDLIATKALNTSSALFFIAATDANLDGYLDVAVLFGNKDVRFYAGSTNGNFQNFGLVGSMNDNWTKPRGIMWGQMNTDNYPDLIVKYEHCAPEDPVGDFIRIHENLTTSFAAPIGHSTWSSRFIIGDLNGDGQDELIDFFNIFGSYSIHLKTDLLSTSPQNKKILYYNSTERCYFSGIAVTDITNDGIQDLVYCNGSPYHSGFLINPGTSDNALGYFNKQRSFFKYESIDYYTNADMDADGNQELVLIKSDVTTSKIVWFKNTSEGQFEEIELLSINKTHHKDLQVAFGDLNGDGKADLVTSMTHPTIYSTFLIIFHVIENEGLISSTDSLIFTEYYEFDTSVLNVQDLNNDGLADILYGNRVYFNDGQVQFSDALTLNANPPLFTHLIDLTNDSLVDFVGIYNYTVRTMVNLGNNSFASLFTGCSMGNWSRSQRPIFNDINSNGHPDLFINYTRLPGQLNKFPRRTFLKFPSIAVFQESPIILLDDDPNEYPSSYIEFFDIDQTGLNDILYYAQNPDGNGIYFNSQILPLDFGERQLAFSHDFENPENRFQIADFTNDGIPDFFTYSLSFENTSLAKEKNEPGRLILRPGAVDGEVGGILFIDVNENGEYDEDDYPVQYEPVGEGASFHRSYSVDDGTFSFQLPYPGTYNITPQFDEILWEITSPFSSFQVELNADTPIIEEVNFGIKPTGSAEIYHIDLLNGKHRCGETTMYTIFIKNKGTTIQELKTTITLDPGTSLVSATHPYLNLGGNTFEFSVGLLKFFEAARIELIVQIPESSTSMSHSLSLSRPDNSIITEKTFDLSLNCNTSNYSIFESTGWSTDNLVRTDTTLVYTVRAANSNEIASSWAELRSLNSQHLDLNTLELLSFNRQPSVSLKPNRTLAAAYNSDFNGNSGDYHQNEIVVRYSVKIVPNTPSETLITTLAQVQFDNQQLTTMPLATNKVYNCEGIDEIQRTAYNANCTSALSIPVTLQLPNAPVGTIADWTVNGSYLGNGLNKLFEAVQMDNLIEVNIQNPLCNVYNEQELTVLFTDSFAINVQVLSSGVWLTTEEGYLEYRWYKNGQLLTTTTDNSIQPVGFGNYRVRVKQMLANCTVWSTELPFFSLETSGTTQQEITVYPNPATEYIRVSAWQSRERFVEATIIDHMGKVCGRYRLEGTIADLPLNHINSGMYTLVLYADDGNTRRFKFVVIK